jgi:hypothetical protein
MCDVAEAMYEQTATVNGSIEASDLPAETGFLWLDKPFHRTDASGLGYQTRVVTWQPQSLRQDGEVRDGVRVTLWCDWAIDPDLGGTSERLRDWAADGTLNDLGPLIMVMSVVIPFGEGFGSVSADGVPQPLHYVHAVWLLMGTEVVATARGQGIPRQVRKRAPGTIKQHEVTVVTLRRAIHHGDGEHGHRDIDWSCRWLVRGFWRHQWGYGGIGRPHEGLPDGGDPQHCRACGARITWVKPYVKGPDDRPLKATETLYRLSR